MIKFPDISEEGCASDDSAKKCAMLPLEDELILKPGVATACSNIGTIQYKAFIRSQGFEVAITQSVIFSSSDTSVVTINATTGLATVVAAGQATISATWFTNQGFARLVILAGTTCCDEIGVGTVIVMDKSFSMTKEFSKTFSSKFEVSRKIANDYVAALNSDKDQMALMEFDISARARVGLTTSKILLKDSIGQMSLYRPVVSVSGNSNIADAIDLALAALEACTQDDIQVDDTGDDTPPVEVVHNFHGNGAPDTSLGMPGDTYVDDLTNGFYWKSVSGWEP